MNRFFANMLYNYNSERADCMDKVLIVTHVSGFVPQFEMSNVRILQKMGYEVHYASNFHNVHYGVDNHRLEGTGIVQHQVDFSRSPRGVRSNMRAYRQLKQLFEEHRFAMVHCHTPVGGFWARLVARKYRKEGTRVIYTAHGFHFYQGGPLKYWLFLFPVERWLAHITDTLITINEEDYRRAQKFRLAKRDGVRGNVYKINGVGIDAELFGTDRKGRADKRREFGIQEDSFFLVSVGELNRNKNHVLVIEALGLLKNPQIRYMICGEGPEKAALIERAEQLGIGNQVILAGFRQDIPDILVAADAMAFPSIREGLCVAAVEALMSGGPLIALENRSTREYMQDGVNGYVVKHNDAKEMAAAIDRMYRLPKEEYESMKGNCRGSVERFTSKHVKRKMEDIYRANL